MENYLKDRIIIAVDGPAGSGKSSVSKEIAKKLCIKYVDSGAIYRAITLQFIRLNEDLESSERINNILDSISLEQKFSNDAVNYTYLNNEDVSLIIRSEEIAKSIGKISDCEIIRHFVNNLLKKWAVSDSIIMDGRDIGTVVFPHASLKLYIDASPEIRATRRINEYNEIGKKVDYEDVKNQIIQRDNQDRNRKFGALKIAEDAVYIDTSDMEKSAVIDMIINLIYEKTNFR